MRIPAVFKPDYERYDGVRPFNVYLLRLLFLLVFLFVGYDSWTQIPPSGRWLRSPLNTRPLAAFP